MTKNEFICTYCIHMTNVCSGRDLVIRAVDLANQMEALVPDIFDKEKEVEHE